MKKIIIATFLLTLSCWPAFSQAGMQERFADLAKVEVHPREKSAGTIYVIAQEHRDPFKAIVLNEENLRIARIQEQISKIILRLSADNDAAHVLLEGELYQKLDEVNSPTLSFIANGKRQRDTCRGLFDQQSADILENRFLSAGTKVQLQSALGRAIGERFRRVETLSFLTSGVHTAYVQSGGGIQLFGGEDGKLQDESLELARKLLDMDEQLQMISGPQQRPSVNGTVTAPDIFGDLLVLRNAMAGIEPGSNLWENTAKLISCLNALPREDLPTIVMPDRAANPFSSITDLKILQNMRDQAWKQFEAVAVTKRSEMAVELTLRMLKEAKAGSGAVVFGLSHKDELLKGFLERGYDAVVITPLFLSK